MCCHPFGQPMTSDSMNLDTAGVKDGDILMALPGNLFNRQRPAETGSVRPTVGLHFMPIFVMSDIFYIKEFNKFVYLFIKSEKAILRAHQLAWKGAVDVGPVFGAKRVDSTRRPGQYWWLGVEKRNSKQRCRQNRRSNQAATWHRNGRKVIFQIQYNSWPQKIPSISALFSEIFVGISAHSYLLNAFFTIVKYPLFCIISKIQVPW